MGAPPMDKYLQDDPLYHFRSSFFQSYQRGLCAHWVRSREAEGVMHDWLLFGRLDVEWQSFPEEEELEPRYPLLWLQFRSVNFLEPNRGDRLHIGRRDLML